MKKLIIGLMAVFGILMLLMVLVGGVFGIIAFAGRDSLPRYVILEADFEQPLRPDVPQDPLAELLTDKQDSLQDVLDAIDQAAGDEHVKAFVARIGAGGMGLADLQEIRDAVVRFRASGKPAIAFAESFGEFGPGNGGYYLATAFDEIWLQPSGDVGVTGLIYESPFIRGALDKLGVEPRMDQRYEYKNAMNMMTERAFTAAHREAMQRIVESQFDQMIRGVAEARQRTPEEIRATFDRAPYLGEEALAAGLVDGLAYRDEVYSKVHERAGDGAKLLFLGRYLERAGRPHRRGTTIAMIRGQGGVKRGSSTYSPLDGSVTMGSDTVAGALRAAIEDDDVKAIVFRVDSPGGSYIASDTIWRETARARAAGKPIIVSMGNVAGSGGYFVAMDAEKIVAQPGTITGSIGVLGGKMLTRGLWEKVGITWDDVHSSTNSPIWSPLQDYDSSEWERFQAALDRIYEDFTTKVAAGRDLPIERVREIAKGRIWTGEDAREIGLVDELGGLDVALRLAREAAGLAPDAAIRLRSFPPERSPFDRLFGPSPDSSERAAVVAAWRQVTISVAPAMRILAQLGVTGGDPGVLAMPGTPPRP